MNLKPIDVVSKPLSVGDYVLVMAKDYRNFTLARVTGFTSKQTRVVYQSSWTSSPSAKHYLTDQVVKLTTEEACSREEKERIDFLYEQELTKKERVA